MTIGGGRGGVAEDGTAFVGAPVLSDRPRFTTAELDLLAQSDALKGQRLELIRGELFKVSPQHSMHARIKASFDRALSVALASEPSLEVLTEVSVAFNEQFTPMPDVVVFESAAVPLTANVFVPGGATRLVVEVAVTSGDFDLGVKLQEYAAAALAEYWVANAETGSVLQHADPTGERYASVVEQPFGATFAALTLPLTIDTSALADLRTE